MTLKKTALPLTLTAALLALLAGILPGSLTPAGVLKAAADLFVADGDFETIKPAFYNRLRPAFLISGLWLLALWGLVRRGRQTGESTWHRLAIGTGAVGVLALVILGGSLAVLQLKSPVYRYLVADLTPAPTPTPDPTLRPTPTATIVPSPTPVPANPARWEQIAADLGELTTFATANDGSGRLFIGGQNGLVRIIRDGQVLDTPFLDLRDRTIQEYGLEQGFLGLAFHPDYTENGYIYVNYIDGGGNTVVSRFKVSPENPDQADPDSEYRLLGILQPDVIHNGGHILFGPDGYLYIGSGDGGPQQDPDHTAQSPDVPLGKLLRIDVDGGEPYGIPPENPFVGTAGLDEIYALGLRNPWRFSFDPETGDLYIGDVGHKTWEEINFIPAGTPPGFNLGWSSYEGVDIYQNDLEPPPPTLADHILPIQVHDHGGGGFCAVVGGHVYRGSAIPALWGTYIYGDYCSGNIWGLRRSEDGRWEAAFLFASGLRITSFGVDEAQELYLLTRAGEVYKLVP